ncbi:MAG TPA: hypothetical protein DET40_00830 [Lentisphaeria bacterium]|nr:MAG: hypothetical protein A2X45_06345 [Lentisphaerae bacterium GWF2_50_93]HCE42076.1 hypothetical protein [Lentisphaeria bacterium]
MKNIPSQNSIFNGKREKYILVCGLEQTLDKIGRHYQLLGTKLGCSMIVYSRNANKSSERFASKYGIEWHEVPEGSKLADIALFWKLLRQYRPRHVEMYLYGAQSFFVYFGYYLTLLLTRTQFVAVCRGGELYYLDKRGPVANFAVWVGLMMANVVVYKQLHMPTQLDQLHITKQKRIFFYNRVPVTTKKTTEDSGVLFLNSWRNFRRPDIVFEAAMLLATRFPNVKFTIAGARNQYEPLDSEGKLTMQVCEAKVNAAGLTNIHLMGWVDNPGELLETYAIFTLPTTLLFLNYTLLEAMEQGLVPIVAHAEGAEKIIDDGVDGFIVDMSAEAFANAIEKLLTDKNMLKCMSIAAKDKIRNEFDLDKGFNELREFYRQRLRWLKEIENPWPLDKTTGHV